MPPLLDRVSKDPCSGNSLLYRKEGRGFLLYSAGPDPQDDQGAPHNDKFPSASYDVGRKAMR